MDKFEIFATWIFALTFGVPALVGVITEHTWLAIISAGILALGLIITAFIKVFKKPKKKKITPQDNQDQNKQ